MSIKLDTDLERDEEQDTDHETTNNSESIMRNDVCFM